jgi:hypothetical protein
MTMTMTMSMRTALIVIVLLSSLLTACDDAPTPEYATAKAAYQSALAETADVTYKGARWDEVLKLLKAVPSSNAKEHRLAQQLVTDIEGTRARIAADLRASDANADRLLDIKSLPPLDTAPPPPKEPTAKDRIAEAKKCIDACTSSFMSCMKAAGCTTRSTEKSERGTRAQFDCPSDGAEKGVACNDVLNACGEKCRP